MTTPTRSTAHRGGPRHARRAPYSRLKVAIAGPLVLAAGLLSAVIATEPTRHAAEPTPPARTRSRTWADTPITVVLAASSRPLTSTTPTVCGDVGTATWGQGQLCWQGDSWWIRARDTKTDGMCVYGYTSDGSVPNLVTACSSTWATSPRQTGFRWGRIKIAECAECAYVRYLTLDNV